MSRKKKFYISFWVTNSKGDVILRNFIFMTGEVNRITCLQNLLTYHKVAGSLKEHSKVWDDFWQLKAL